MSEISSILADVAEAPFDQTGRPVPGKLQATWLTVTQEGWEAVAVFRFIERWNVFRGPDPVECLRLALTTPPNTAPLDRVKLAPAEITNAVLSPALNVQPESVLVDDDLLV